MAVESAPTEGSRRTIQRGGRMAMFASRAGYTRRRIQLPHDIGDAGWKVMYIRQKYQRCSRSRNRVNIPTLRRTTPRPGTIRQEQSICSCRPFRRKYPEMIIMPATMPPRKRYTGISHPQMCRTGSIIGLARVVVSSCMVRGLFM